MLQVLRVRDFRLLWGAGFVSSLGSWLLALAVPAHIFLVTGSTAATGLTLAANYLPFLVLGPAAGVLVDRWDRRRVMIAADLFRAAVVAAMLLALSPGHYWVIYLALVAESSATVLFSPAWQAQTPAVVGTGSLLSSANALNSLSDGAVRLVGGPLGGILLAAVGIRALICADVVSYLASAAALLMTSRRSRERPARGAAGRGVRSDLIEGLRTLAAQPVARALLPVTMIFLAANASLSAVLIPFALGHLGGSAQAGWLFSALGVGFLLGAPALKIMLDRCQPRHLLAAALGATAIGYSWLFRTSSLTAALPAAASVGAAGSMALMAGQTAVQRVIPGAILGRVTAVFLAGEAAATLAGAVIGPAVAQPFGLFTLAAAASATTLAAALLTCLLVPPMPGTIPGMPSHVTGATGRRHSGSGGAVVASMPNISKVLARVFVPDLDAAVPLYEELAQARAEKFGFRDVELARIGPFLLLAGNTAAYRDRTATIQVASLAPVLAALESAGGEVVEGPAPAPKGARLIARHPDGAVFEYIETGEAG
jgi:Na+/melibiose symporter-like transporter